VRVVLYPADTYACGHYRMIWPAQVLRAAGHDVTVVEPEDRGSKLSISVQDDHVVDVHVEPGTDVIVLQRVTHRYLAQAVPIIRSKGAAVVVDIDDDLTSIHPGNPAWERLHPRNFGKPNLAREGKIHMHSWNHLAAACRDATLVTVSTAALARRYASHGRYHVLRNCLPDHHYEVADSYDPTNAEIGWPASLHSHPDDPTVIGPAIARLVQDGVAFRIVGDSTNCGVAFGIGDDPPGADVEFGAWPQALTSIGIGITPLADTKFNAAKSWLKPLELAGAGVPWIGSPRTEYAALAHEGCGVLAERPKDWYRMLRALVRDEARRRELSEAGRAVAGRWRLADHAWRWYDAWVDAAFIERGQPRRDRVVAGASSRDVAGATATPFRQPLGIQAT
jgi:hypothetical protein